jgi:hypothetical protein
VPSKLSFVSLSVSALLMLSITCVISATQQQIAYALRFDPETGIGFINKGELQRGFGMNDAELQENFSGYLL